MPGVARKPAPVRAAARAAPVRSTFEAGGFWRDVLATAFSLQERVIDLGDVGIHVWKHRLYNRWVSTPYRDRVALSWSALPAHLDVDRLVETVTGRYDQLVLKDIGPFVGTWPQARRSIRRQQHTNSDVALDDRIENRLHRSARKNLRKSREDYGLEIDIDPPDCFDAYFACYLGTRRRLGVPPYERRFFRLLFDRIGGPVTLFRCRQGRTPIGYLLCYLHGDEMISAHIAYDFDRRHMRITDYLFMSAFFWGAENGFRTYRFGGDFNNQTSLLAAKQKLGAVPRQQIDLVTPPASPVGDDPDGIVRKVLRATPMPVFRHAGLLTRIYFQ